MLSKNYCKFHCYATFEIKTPLRGLQKISVNHTYPYLIWKCSILPRVNTFHIRYDMYDWQKSFANRSEEFWFRRSRSSEIDGKASEAEIWQLGCYTAVVDMIWLESTWKLRYEKLLETVKSNRTLATFRILPWRYQSKEISERNYYMLQAYLLHVLI